MRDESEDYSDREYPPPPRWLVDLAFYFAALAVAATFFLVVTAPWATDWVRR